MATITFGPFEWDEDKADRNARKHGVSFHTAADALSGPPEDQLIRFDDAHSDTEDRLVMLAPYPDQPRLLLLICTTERRYHGGESVTRIIGARRASPRERDDYEAWRLGT